MSKLLMAATLAMLAPAAAALAADDVTTPIHQFLDGFNTGDTKSAYAAYDKGEISIIDEFPPHRWVGPHAAEIWAGDYDIHAKQTGVSDGSVSYEKPTRTQIEGDAAYVVIPTLYTYKQTGKPTREEGQMTFALHHTKAGWKIRSWTWTGVYPHPAK